MQSNVIDFTTQLYLRMRRGNSLPPFVCVSVLCSANIRQAYTFTLQTCIRHQTAEACSFDDEHNGQKASPQPHQHENMRVWLFGCLA